MRMVATYAAHRHFDDKDATIHSIFAGHGDHVGSGFSFAEDERDIEYDVDDAAALSVAERLIDAGFKVDCP